MPLSSAPHSWEGHCTESRLQYSGLRLGVTTEEERRVSGLHTVVHTYPVWGLQSASQQPAVKMGPLHNQRPQGPGDLHIETPALSLDKMVGLCRQVDDQAPSGVCRCRKSCSSPLVKNVQMLVKKHLYGLFCLQVFIIRHPSGVHRAGHVGPGNFLPQRLCFLSLLLLKGQVEALLQILINPFSLPATLQTNPAASL